MGGDLLLRRDRGGAMAEKQPVKNGNGKRHLALTAVAQVVAILIGLAAISDWFIAPRAEDTVRRIIDPLQQRLRSLETQQAAMTARLSLLEEIIREMRNDLKKR